MLVHGIPKLMTLVSGEYGGFPDPLGIGNLFSLIGAVFAEFLCSVLIIFGFKTRLAAVVLAFTMGTAAFIVHASDPWAVKEKAILFLAVYIVLIISGAGSFSVDKK